MPDNQTICPHCGFRAYNVHHMMEHLATCEPIYNKAKHQGKGYPWSPSWHVDPEVMDFVTDIRKDRHGNKEDSFGQIASYWEVFRNYQDAHPEDDVTAALRMMLFKLARWQTTGKDDHIYDMWKYAEEAYHRYSDD